MILPLETNGVAFDGDIILSNSSPVAYSERTFMMYSEDFSLVGMHNVQVVAYLTDFHDIQSEIMDFQIEFIDACIDPASVTVQPYQMFSGEYIYG